MMIKAINWLIECRSDFHLKIFVITLMNRFLPWLIWATYNAFPKISENKRENRSKITWPSKILCHRVFYMLFCILFCDILGNEKHAAASLGSGYIVTFFFIPTRNDFRKMTLNHNSVAEYFLWSTKCKNFQITWKRTKIQWFSILKASLNLLNDKIFKVYSLVVHNSIYANLHFLPIFISYPHGVILWKSPLL